MLKKLKKFMVLLVTVAMLFTLVGCTNDAGEGSGETSEPGTEQGVEDSGADSAEDLNNAEETQ